MPRRRFAKLKAAMYEAEITQADLARATGRGTTYIARRLNGREPFNIEDMKHISSMLSIPRSAWLDYFMDESA